MANPEHLAILKRGVKVWNDWRKGQPELRPDLGEADLAGADLNGADLSKARLCQGNMTASNLSQANLVGADLTNAILDGAWLNSANLSDCRLFGAKFGYGLGYFSENLGGDSVGTINLLADEIKSEGGDWSILESGDPPESNDVYRFLPGAPGSRPFYGR